MNEIVFLSTANELSDGYAVLFSPDGSMIWKPVDEAWSSDFAFATFEVSNDANRIRDYGLPLNGGAGATTGVWYGDFPTVITEPAVYPVRGYSINPSQVVSALTSRTIPWSGSEIIATPSVPILSYRSVADHTTYLSALLHTEAWSTLSTDKRQQAANEAAKIIDRFAYLGQPSTAKEWPRSGIYINKALLDSTVIPVDILNAESEIALALASGIDPEKELRRLNVTSRGFSSVRTTYDPKLVPPHLQYGVPSAAGWAYLFPYLTKDTGGTIILRRV